uniref:Uncharacterized protein n=1 Tax=Arundo donax TaxID=35708 RepID=A0A0A9G0A5_ARUDO
MGCKADAVGMFVVSSWCSRCEESAWNSPGKEIAHGDDLAGLGEGHGGDGDLAMGTVRQ